jgi:hypothetical protein
MNCMNEIRPTGAPPPSPSGAGNHDYAVHAGNHGILSPQQLRAVGQRRRDAEEKLEQHQQDARNKPEPENGPEAAPAQQ